MEEFEKNEGLMENDSKFREEIYSKAVRAGKRTYFFDVKSTRRDELYLTITESKKRFEQDGNFHFEKHKVFLYREDFEKFVDGLQEVISYIDQNQGVEYDSAIASEYEGVNSNKINDLEVVGSAKDYTNIDFDDLSH
ncbi:MAG TPA: DUF3276 family protein [Prolixibacteraceae bacterium]|jgi:hypothetical protein